MYSMTMVKIGMQTLSFLFTLWLNYFFSALEIKSTLANHWSSLRRTIWTRCLSISCTLLVTITCNNRTYWKYCHVWNITFHHQCVPLETNVDNSICYDGNKARTLCYYTICSTDKMVEENQSPIGEPYNKSLLLLVNDRQLVGALQ